MDKREIALPEARTKNGRPHLIPLSQEALLVIKRPPQGQARSPVRQRRRRLLRLVQGQGGARRADSRGQDRARPKGKADAGLDTARPPTLVVTHVSEHGIAQPHVVEAIVNHVAGHKGGVAGIYNRAAYAAEKRAALELWGIRSRPLSRGAGATLWRCAPESGFTKCAAPAANRLRKSLTAVRRPRVLPITQCNGDRREPSLWRFSMSSSWQKREAPEPADESRIIRA